MSRYVERSPRPGAWLLLLATSTVFWAAMVSTDDDALVTATVMVGLLTVVAGAMMWRDGRLSTIRLTDDSLDVGRTRVPVSELHPWGVCPPGILVDGPILGADADGPLGTGVLTLVRRDGGAVLVQTRNASELSAALDTVLAPLRDLELPWSADRDPGSDLPGGSPIDMWASLGREDHADVDDALSARQFHGLPAHAPFVHRCVVTVGEHRVALRWEQRVLVASLVTGDGTTVHEIARGTRQTGDGPGSFSWSHARMPLDVGGRPVDVGRERSGDGWLWRVSGPDERSWTFRPGDPVVTDHVELTRDGDRAPVVIHTLRPVPGAPGPGAGARRVSWTPDASLAEVVLVVMWVLDRVHEGLLPTAERLARGEVPN
ncbi:hypothetical protein [Sanguibacter sp. 25GB23B1]|uniref:hypothetical protein n=1 Tax=unclassified Sanguibacter TaxID=2645534 RepID=UPI0032AF9BF5